MISMMASVSLAAGKQLGSMFLIEARDIEYKIKLIRTVTNNIQTKTKYKNLFVKRLEDRSHLFFDRHK